VKHEKYLFLTLPIAAYLLYANFFQSLNFQLLNPLKLLVSIVAYSGLMAFTKRNALKESILRIFSAHALLAIVFTAVMFLAGIIAGFLPGGLPGAAYWWLNIGVVYGIAYFAFASWLPKPFENDWLNALAAAIPFIYMAAEWI